MRLTFLSTRRAHSRAIACGMPRTALLLGRTIADWGGGATPDEVPGGSMPYGLQHLTNDFELTWSERQHTGLWRRRLPRAAGGVMRRAAPGLQGSVAAWHARHLLADADVALSVFENAGSGLARAQQLARRGPGWATSRAATVPHAMLVCWLAEDCASMSPSGLRSVRRSLSGADAVMVFSRNQVAIMRDRIGVAEERIHVVPFGVDTSYYDAGRMSTPPGGGGLVAVGSDSRRDYATLFEAVRMVGVELTLACRPRNVAGLNVPAQVRIVDGVFDADYRKLLHHADLVVTPTTAPAYPSGQSVVLEAMAMGRATVTTNSPAMRDYVRDGVDGDLVAVHRPDLMAERITSLLRDDARRAMLGAAASASVREHFALPHLWRGVAAVLRHLAAR